MNNQAKTIRFHFWSKINTGLIAVCITLLGLITNTVRNIYQMQLRNATEIVKVNSRQDSLSLAQIFQAHQYEGEFTNIHTEITQLRQGGIR